jgi:nitroreductase
MGLNPILAGRRSVRAFGERAVSDEDLAALIEAARWSPSSGNMQPWRFLARASADSRAELAPCLSRGNQWALKAPLLLVLVTRLDWGTRANGLDYALYDCGQAALSLTFEAEARGLRVHQIGGWLKEPLQQTLRLPDPVTPVTVLAVG